MNQKLTTSAKVERKQSAMALAELLYDIFKEEMATGKIGSEGNKINKQSNTRRETND